MRKIIIILVFSSLFTSVNSQQFHTVPYYQWSSKMAFQMSPSPRIMGYGPLSDSLSKAHHDSTFYEYNGEYYPITCWADYYLWFVKKFWYKFLNPELYEYYYNAKDDYGMANYIVSGFFRCDNYPSLIAVSFPDRSVFRNDLSRHKIRRCIRKNPEEKDQYVAKNKELKYGKYIIKKEPFDEGSKNRKTNEKTKEQITRLNNEKKNQNKNLNSGNIKNTSTYRNNSSANSINRSNSLPINSINRNNNSSGNSINNSNNTTTIRQTPNNKVNKLK